MKTQDKKRILFMACLGGGLLLVLTPVVLFLACDHTLGYVRDVIDPTFTVRASAIENGTIRPMPDSGIAGTQITLAINPKPGFRLKSGSLRRAVGNQPPALDSNLNAAPYRFFLDDHSVIYGEFEAVPRNNYSASVDNGIIGGIVTVYSQLDTLVGIRMDPPYGLPGKPMVLRFYPDDGFYLKDGSVTYVQLDANGDQVGSSVVLTPPYEFLLPSANVLVKAEFESGAITSYIESGKKALLRNDYNSAVIAFDTAYKIAPTNKEAIFYSTLGRIASIAVDAKVRLLMQSVGFGSYPGNLNNLLGIGDSWDNFEDGVGSQVYNQRPSWLSDYSGIRLPKFGAPQGYYAFQNQQAVMQDTKDINGFETMATWQMVMFFNLMGSNIKDLNYTVDDALEYIFGNAFESAALRPAQLGYTDKIVLDQQIIDKLFLGNILAGGDSVGRSELELMITGIRVFKAGLEWLASYDLEFDRYIFRLWTYVGGGNFLPTWFDLYDLLNKPYVDPSQLKNPSVDVKSLINEILDFLLTNMDDYFVEHPGETSRIPDILPLRNHLFKQRPSAQSMMDKSKADMIMAIDTVSAIYDHYFNTGVVIPQIVRNRVLVDYKWVKGGLADLKTAIQTGGTFYFPENMPSGTTSWDFSSTNSNNKYGIDFGRFYTPGQLSVDKLIVTEPGGKRPKFFGWGSNTSIDGTYIEDSKDFAKYQWVGFQLNLSSLKQVFIKGLEKSGHPLNNTEYVHTLFPNILFNKRNGGQLYKFYFDEYSYTLK